MSEKAKAMRQLYRMKRVTLDAMKKAVYDGVLTKDEYATITGKTL